MQRTPDQRQRGHTLGSVTEFVHVWLTKTLRTHALHSVYSTAVLVVLAVAAHVIAYWLLVWLLVGAAARGGRFGGMRAGEALGVWVFIVPLVVLAIMHPVYWIWGRRKGRTVKLKSGTVTIVDERFAPSALVETADTADQQGNKAIVDGLTFPAWLFGLALKHFWLAGALRKADPWPPTRVLIFLYTEARRLSLHDLEEALNEPELAAALRTLQHVPGVLFTARGYPSVTLNSDLRSDLERILR